jgi:hypothetical protein
MDCIPSIDGRCGMNAPHDPTKTKSAAPVEENALFASNEPDSATNQAKFAIAGHALYKTTNPDGSILYLATRWGFVRELKSLEAVAAFFAMIGGAK